jgi:hypothetical protein
MQLGTAQTRLRQSTPYLTHIGPNSVYKATESLYKSLRERNSAFLLSKTAPEGVDVESGSKSTLLNPFFQYRSISVGAIDLAF